MSKNKKKKECSLNFFLFFDIFDKIIFFLFFLPKKNVLKLIYYSTIKFCLLRTLSVNVLMLQFF